MPDLADDVNFSIGYAQRVEGLGGLGASFGYLSYGKSTATDVDGNDIREFTSNEIAPAIAYGTDLIPNMGFGVALKLVRVDLAPEDVTLDGRAGRARRYCRLRLAHKLSTGASLGAGLYNIGPDIAYIDEDQSDPLGRNVRVGLAWVPIEANVHRVTISANAARFLLGPYARGRASGVPAPSTRFNHLLALRARYYAIRSEP